MKNCMYVWVRDHRQHHKYSDTDADPHNASRGFFFSHVGWLMSKKHPLVSFLENFVINIYSERFEKDLSNDLRQLQLKCPIKS